MTDEEIKKEYTEFYNAHKGHGQVHLLDIILKFLVPLIRKICDEQNRSR